MRVLYPKKELLVPAGNYECFIKALENGADAVYLSHTSFGARAYAKNFTNDELKEVIKLGHLYGVKVYITMNTMIKEREVSSFIEQVSYLYKLGVDAILMQDIGMICLCREMFKDLEIHASTQFNASTKETIKILEEIGVKRVVLPREMTLKEINELDTSLEKEVFIHGALCVSYSGNCLFSFLNGGRSANRGECAGCCRLPFKLYQGNKRLKEGYLLSMKDLHTAPYFKDLLESNITSFKIEGRMKSPSYVACVTSYYRKLLDGEIPTNKDLDDLKVEFYREFTGGHLFKQKDLINSLYSNHQGLLIGDVLEVTPQRIKIHLSKDLYQEDGIRFQKSQKGLIVNFLYDEKGKLTSFIPKGGTAIIKNTINLKEKDLVYKTSSKYLDQELSTVRRKKIPISLTLIAHKNNDVILKLDDGVNKVSISGSKVEEAKTRASTKDELKLNLTRMKQTPYEVQSIDFQIDDDIFLRVGEINDLRRKAVDALSQERIKVLPRKIENVNFSKSTKTYPKVFTAYVRSEKALKQALEQNFTRIYVASEELYQLYKENPKVYLALLRNKLSTKAYEAPIFSKELRKNSYLGYSLNVANSYSAYYLSKLGAKSICLSVELTNEECQELLESINKKFGTLPLEMIIKGRIDAMVIKGNPFNILNNDLYLQDLKGKKYPLIYKEGLTLVESSESLDKQKEIDKWYSLGVSAFCQIFDD